MPLPPAVLARRARVAAAAQQANITLSPDLTPAASTPAAVAQPAPTPAAPTPAPVPAQPTAPAPTPVAATPAPAPAQPAATAAPAPVAAAPSPDLLADLAHLRKEAQIAAQLQEQLAARDARLAELEAQLVQAPATPATAPAAQPDPNLAVLQQQLQAAQEELRQLRKPTLSAEGWNNQAVDFEQARALWTGFEPLINRMVEDRLAQMLPQQLQQTVDPLRQQVTTEVTGVKETLARQRQQAFEQAVLTALPAAQDIVPSVSFKQFLATEVPMAGITYGEAFNRHVTGQNVQGVVAVLRQYQSTLAPQTPTAVDVPAAAAPTALPTQTPGAPQLPDLADLRTKFRRKQISAAEYSAQLAKAEQVLRGNAASVH